MKLKIKKNHVILFLSIIIFLLLLSNMVLLLSHRILLNDIVPSLQGRVKNLDQSNRDLFSINVYYQDKLDVMNASKIKVETEFFELEDKYNILDLRYKELKLEADKTIKEVSLFQKDIQESMDWFRENAIIDANYDNTKVTSNLKKSCFEYSEDTKKCSIKLSCFFLVNQERLGYHYKYDVFTSEVADKLQSLSDFMTNKGGDCEDYSLFFKAEYNYLLSECERKGAEEIELEAWEDIGGKDWYWMHFGDMWYLEGAEGKKIDEGHIFPIVFCGNVYDFNTGAVNGHCMLGFTKEKIVDVKDLSSLIDIPVVEPQNGKYMGEYDLYGNPNVFYLITDNDMFLYSGGQWLGYTSFNDKLEKQRMELAKFKFGLR